MKSRIWKSVSVVALVAMFAFVGTVPSTSAGPGKAGKLEGTWLVEITIRNCQTGDAVAPPFVSLLTFSRGGTLTESTSRSSPSVRGSGHGSWDRSNGGGYTASHTAFLYSPEGAWTGMQKVTQSITIGADPNVFEADAMSQVTDTSGNVVMSGCSSAVGHRLE